MVPRGALAAELEPVEGMSGRAPVFVGRVVAGPADRIEERSYLGIESATGVQQPDAGGPIEPPSLTSV